MWGRDTPAALLVLLPKLPDVPVCRRLPGCPPASLMASYPSGQVSLRFFPLGWFHQCTTTSEAVFYRKLCCHRLHHLLGATVESTDQREESCQIRDGSCKRETWLFVSWVSVQRESAVRRARESQGGFFSEERVICILSVVFVQALASGREKLCTSLSCDVAQEKLLKARITFVFLDRCCPPFLCLPSRSCLVLYSLKERSLHRQMPYVKQCS